MSARGVLVRIDSGSGASGWGDVAPLPGFSRESIGDAEAELVVWAARMRGTKFDPQGDDFGASVGFEPAAAMSPSVRFGLETALANLSRRMEDRSAAELACFDGAVPVNGLLAGSREQVLADARRLRDGGCRAVKLKVGSRPVAEDVDLTGAVRSVIGDGMELRLDANRSWSLEQAVEFGRAVGDTNIEYLEEPLRDPAHLADFFNATGILGGVGREPSGAPAGRSRWTPGGGRGGVEADPPGGHRKGPGMGGQGVGVERAPGGERLLRERRRPAGAGGVCLGFHGGRGARGSRHLSLARRRRGPAAHSVPTGSHSMERRAGAGSPHRWIEAERDTA